MAWGTGLSVLTQAGVHGWVSIHAPGCSQGPDTQHLCAPGVFTLLQSVKKQCTTPNTGKLTEDDKFSFPGSSAGKRSRVLPGEETGLWLAQPLPNRTSRSLLGNPQLSGQGYRGPKLLWLPDPATLALWPCRERADFL